MAYLLSLHIRENKIVVYYNTYIYSANKTDFLLTIILLNPPPSPKLSLQGIKKYEHPYHTIKA